MGHLYIFNFDMIKKTLLTFLIIISTYIIFIQYFSNPDKYTSEHQWQDNQITVQRFLYNHTDSINHFIVGSSLAFRLRGEDLPGFYNLSYGGLSAFDGLNSLAKKNIYPRYLFIEMNFIDRPVNKEFNSSLNNPLMCVLRKHFLAFRDGKQPISFIAFPIGHRLSLYTLYVLQSGIHKIIPENTYSNMKNKSINANPMETEIIPRQMKRFSIEPADIDKTMKDLGKYVSVLEEHGTKIIFFEMPIQHQLENSPRCIAVRSAFYHNFPRDKYTYIDSPDMKEYETTDGIHLNYPYAKKYTEYFYRQIKNLGLDR